MKIVPAQERERERDLLWVFDFALVLKAVDGTIEMASAVVIFWYPRVIMHLADIATAGELSQDPTDIVANAIRNAAHALSLSGHLLIALYLFVHGLIKALLVIGIFAGQRIAYPLFIAALALFSAYETYRGLVRHEAILLIFAAFDLLLLVLTAYEYRRRYPKTPAVAA